MGFFENVQWVRRVDVWFRIFTKVVGGYGHVRDDVGRVFDVRQIGDFLSRYGCVRTVDLFQSRNDSRLGQVPPGTEHQAVIHLIKQKKIETCR